MRSTGACDPTALHAREDDRKIQRFGHVIVRPQPQRLDHVFAVRPRRRDDHRKLRRRMCCSQRSQHVEAAQSRHLDVQQHQVERFAHRALDGRQCLPPVARDLDRHAAPRSRRDSMSRLFSSSSTTSNRAFTTSFSVTSCVTGASYEFGPTGARNSSHIDAFPEPCSTPAITATARLKFPKAGCPKQATRLTIPFRPRRARREERMSRKIPLEEHIETPAEERLACVTHGIGALLGSPPLLSWSRSPPCGATPAASSRSASTGRPSSSSTSPPRSTTHATASAPQAESHACTSSTTSRSTF